jgi:hypothetical protein
VPSTQLLCIGFHAEGPCLAHLAKLQLGGGGYPGLMPMLVYG